MSFNSAWWQNSNNKILVNPVRCLWAAVNWRWSGGGWQAFATKEDRLAQDWMGNAFIFPYHYSDILRQLDRGNEFKIEYSLVQILEITFINQHWFLKHFLHNNDIIFAVKESSREPNKSLGANESDFVFHVSWPRSQAQTDFFIEPSGSLWESFCKWGFVSRDHGKGSLSITVDGSRAWLIVVNKHFHLEGCQFRFSPVWQWQQFLCFWEL